MKRLMTVPVHLRSGMGDCERAEEYSKQNRKWGVPGVTRGTVLETGDHGLGVDVPLNLRSAHDGKRSPQRMHSAKVP